VVVYLHGNSSNRLEAGGIVATLLTNGISLFCFDAAGCGLSEGDYISLGWHERDDLAIVLEHLRKQPGIGPIGLWGRSMGAVTALLHADRDPQLCAICLDSPFASLRRLAEDLAQSRHMVFKVPSWLVDAALAVVRMRVQTLAGFDIEDVVPLDHAKRSSVPAIFMHARQDTFISTAHSKQLYQAYQGPKQMVTVEGDHNTERCQQAVNQAVGFFRRSFSSSSSSGAAPAATPTSVSTPSRHQQPPRPYAQQPQLQKVHSGQQPQLQAVRSGGLAAAIPSGPHKQAASWSPPVLHPRPQPSPPQAPSQQATLPIGKAAARGPLLTLEFSPNWQAVLEGKLRQLGLATPEARSQLRAVDRMGIPVSICAGPGGAGCLVPGRFPLAIEWGGAVGGLPEQQMGVQSPMPAATPGWYSRTASGGG